MAVTIINKWVGYVTRTFDQFKDSLLAKLPVDLPEITDYSDSNPFIYRLNVWAGILEHLSYYVDRAAKDSFLSQTTLREVAFYLAYQADYRVKGRVPANVDLLFTLDAPATAIVIIPQGTEVSTTKGISFFTTSPVQINIGETQVEVGGTQLEIIAPVIIGTSDGSLNQSFSIPDTNIADELISVQVGVTNYGGVETFAYSLGDVEVYKAQQNIDGEFEVVFGDDVNGAIPSSGQDITVSYGVTDGFNGNVGANEITNIVDSITVPSGLVLSVSNPIKASGGANEDDLSTLKHKIPLHRFTLERAVSEYDYAAIANLVAGVSKAGALRVECTKVNVHIVPIGGGIASSVLRNAVRAFFVDKEILGIDLNVESAGELLVFLGMDLEVLPNFLRTTVVQSVRDNLAEFFNPINQDVNGRVKISDVTGVIENTDGVDTVEFLAFTARPSAIPVNHDTQLIWDRLTLSGSENNYEWRIKIQSATMYEIFRNNNFVGLGEIGVQQSYSEVEFTVNAGVYTIGQEWTFRTYIYNKSIDLNEMSIPAIDNNDIVFNSVIGGS